MGVAEGASPDLDRGARDAPVVCSRHCALLAGRQCGKPGPIEGAPPVRQTRAAPAEAQLATCLWAHCLSRRRSPSGRGISPLRLGTGRTGGAPGSVLSAPFGAIGGRNLRGLARPPAGEERATARDPDRLGLRPDAMRSGACGAMLDRGRASPRCNPNAAPPAAVECGRGFALRRPSGSTRRGATEIH